MSDTNTPAETTTSAPAGTVTEPSTSTTDTTAPAAEFEGEFDMERAAKLVENLRADKAKMAERLAAFESAEQAAREAQMSEVEKAQAALAAANAEIAKRDKVLADMTAAQQRRDILARHKIEEDDDVKALLDGVPADQLEARVTALVKLRGPARESAAEAIPGKPTPRLTAGHQGNDAPGTPDIRTIAENILNRR